MILVRFEITNRCLFHLLFRILDYLVVDGGKCLFQIIFVSAAILRRPFNRSFVEGKFKFEFNVTNLIVISTSKR